MREPVELVRRHLRPAPRLDEGRALAAAGAAAMIDLSDGLATDAAHLAEASGVELRLRLDALPCAPGVEPEAAARGGDDYELLFTIAPERRAAAEAAAPVSWLGEVRAGSGLVLLDAGGRPVEGLRGYEHRSGSRLSMAAATSPGSILYSPLSISRASSPLSLVPIRATTYLPAQREARPERRLPGGRRLRDLGG